MKKIIKEMGVMLLLFIAIGLILAVIFYDYNPINKEIPAIITYEMPDELSDIKEELDKTLPNDEEQIVKTYELTKEELKEYANKNYDAGKVNPFTFYKEGQSNDGNNSVNTTIKDNVISNKNENSTNNVSSGQDIQENVPELITKYTTSKIINDFKGFNQYNIYELSNGQIWIQTNYKDTYHYAYRPEVIIYKENNRYYMKVEGIDDIVEVEILKVTSKSKIVNNFIGFNQYNIYELENGKVLIQTNYKYKYNYDYKPEVIIYEYNGEMYMQVKGMDDKITVAPVSKYKKEKLANAIDNFGNETTSSMLNTRYILNDGTKLKQIGTGIGIIDRNADVILVQYGGVLYAQIGQANGINVIITD